MILVKILNQSPHHTNKMNLIQFDDQFNVVSPKGTLFIEKKADSVIQLRHAANKIYDENPIITITNQIDQKETQLTLTLEQFSCFYTATTELKNYSCGLYVIKTPKSEMKFTISPQISHIHMCTIYTHQVHSILDNIKDMPYNWLHLTPLPKPGPSMSAYSMDSFDQYLLNDEQIQKVKQKNILIDVVLNHLSPSSHVLVDVNHTYNNINRPDLKPAAVFDFHLQILNHYVQSSTHELIINQVADIYDALKLAEFEMVSIPTKKGSNLPIDNIDFIKAIKLNGKRNGGTLDEDYLKSINIDKNLHYAVAMSYNKLVETRCLSEKTEILQNLSGSVAYELSQKSKWIFTNYFSVIKEVSGNQNCNKKFNEQFGKLLAESKTYREFIEKNKKLLEEIESDKYILGASNGWVMGAAIKFANPALRIYNRRTLIAWGDCCKLNYENNLVLQKLAQQYVENMAKLFNGLRIDNAHSSDENVLTQLLFNARKHNTSLLVMLEVFMGSPELDDQFCQKVGGDLIVKEMSHYDNVEKLCGPPTILSVNSGLNVIGDFQPIEYKVLHKSAPVMLFDFTHDNQPPGSIKSAHGAGNALCCAAICVACEGVASATTYGVDLGVSDQIIVTDQTPCYTKFQNFTMTQYRKMLNGLKEELTKYDKVYAHNHGNFMTVERMNSKTCESYIFLITPDFKSTFEEEIQITCEGTFGGTFFASQYTQGKIEFHQKQLLSDNFVTIADPLLINQYSPLCFNVKCTVKPGQVIIFKKTIKEINDLLGKIPALAAKLQPELEKFNIIQWKSFLVCHEEEDQIYGINKYSFGSISPTVCGFDGLHDCLTRTSNAEAVAQNVRQGDWMIDHFIHRNDKLGVHVSALEELLILVKQSIPSSFKPFLLCSIYSEANKIIENTIMKKYKYTNPLQAQLFRSGLLIIGYRPGWSNVDQMKWLTPQFKETMNTLIENEKADDFEERKKSTIEFVSAHKKQKTIRLQWKSEAMTNLHPEKFFDVSVAAGFPHFFTGMFRSWGRDIFLSVNGLIATQSPSSARIMLVSTASLVRHGLLPNLQDSGRMPRYNCRDAVWYWTSALCQFIQLHDDAILNDTVKRIFVSDDENDYRFDETQMCWVLKDNSKAKYPDSSKPQTIKQILVEIFKKHLNGISFEEWTCQDDNMKPEGKQVDAYVDKQTGFVYGGNQYNCHTWMDKMGGSDKHHNRGVPSTSRSGAAVEINLCALFTLQELHQKINDAEISKWYQNLKKNIHQFKITKNGMKYLKDCLDSEELRPNYIIGLSYFDEEFVKQYKDEVHTAFSHLLEPNSIGMKTLAPSEPRYVSWYDNDDQTGFATANGFSYHNGPEWVHPMGRALLCLAKIGDQKLFETRLVNFYRHLYNGCYVNGNVKSLPELTQGDAHCCWASCSSQSWALGCVLEALSYKK